MCSDNFECSVEQWVVLEGLLNFVMSSFPLLEHHSCILFAGVDDVGSWLAGPSRLSLLQTEALSSLLHSSR